MWLTTHGVPFHVAFRTDPAKFRMDDVTRAALAIICAEFEGRRFNFSSFSFESNE